MTSRRATIARATAETDIRLEIDLDGSGAFTGGTGVGFFDHMLHQIARHGLIDIELSAAGDTHIDDHHTVEDVGLCLGRALAEAVGDKRGITRYGHAYVPLDEALSRVVVDLSGRPGLFFDAAFTRDKIGTFDVELVREFFQGVASAGAITLHMDSLKGDNAHHIAETLFKAFGRALRMAVAGDARAEGAMPSTKGRL
ncbi:imidazoleglycerol-phosphate dehydratase [Salinisphaera orenii MK-B5]|uniref:Imidazoleglycerol-phosphate dehydratase n=2 Tax=Salinisphaera orenii TaxID=856731 RepID=A0A423PGE1_9GAMM|nr:MULTISPECIES: imidazoleglycerol-phosphate dehydratase HisB [Salinisphaera]ROO24635.1 imidazoleglycerol-phosphate dehydratase [Salinisphaera orenii MK-B5]ROO25289.1 imidazoleglycerol-phosphate dehydratase [Salinisphaera halophila YIM 95161]